MLLEHAGFSFILHIIACCDLLQFVLSYGGSMPNYISFFPVQKAKKSYQKDLENNQRNAEGDSSAAPGEGCFL